MRPRRPPPALPTGDYGGLPPPPPGGPPPRRVPLARDIALGGAEDMDIDAHPELEQAMIRVGEQRQRLRGENRNLRENIADLRADMEHIQEGINERVERAVARVEARQPQPMEPDEVAPANPDRRAQDEIARLQRRIGELERQVPAAQQIDVDAADAALREARAMVARLERELAQERERANANEARMDAEAAQTMQERITALERELAEAQAPTAPMEVDEIERLQMELQQVRQEQAAAARAQQEAWDRERQQLHENLAAHGQRERDLLHQIGEHAHIERALQDELDALTLERDNVQADLDRLGPQVNRTARERQQATQMEERVAELEREREELRVRLSDEEQNSRTLTQALSRESTEREREVETARQRAIGTLQAELRVTKEHQAQLQTQIRTLTERAELAELNQELGEDQVRNAKRLVEHAAEQAALARIKTEQLERLLEERDQAFQETQAQFEQAGGEALEQFQNATRKHETQIQQLETEWEHKLEQQKQEVTRLQRFETLFSEQLTMTDELQQRSNKLILELQARTAEAERRRARLAPELVHTADYIPPPSAAPRPRPQLAQQTQQAVDIQPTEVTTTTTTTDFNPTQWAERAMSGAAGTSTTQSSLRSPGASRSVITTTPREPAPQDISQPAPMQEELRPPAPQVEELAPQRPHPLPSPPTQTPLPAKQQELRKQILRINKEISEFRRDFPTPTLAQTSLLRRMQQSRHQLTMEEIAQFPPQAEDREFIEDEYKDAEADFKRLSAEAAKLQTSALAKQRAKEAATEASYRWEAAKAMKEALPVRGQKRRTIQPAPSTADISAGHTKIPHLETPPPVNITINTGAPPVPPPPPAEPSSSGTTSSYNPELEPHNSLLTPNPETGAITIPPGTDPYKLPDTRSVDEVEAERRRTKQRSPLAQGAKIYVKTLMHQPTGNVVAWALADQFSPEIREELQMVYGMNYYDLIEWLREFPPKRTMPNPRAFWDYVQRNEKRAHDPTKYASEGYTAEPFIAPEEPPEAEFPPQRIGEVDRRRAAARAAQQQRVLPPERIPPPEPPQPTPIPVRRRVTLQPARPEEPTPPPEEPTPPPEPIPPEEPVQQTGWTSWQ